MEKDDVGKKVISLFNSSPPVSQRQIAKSLGIGKSTVAYWIKKYKNELEGKSPAKRGRPSTVSSDQRREARLRYARAKRENPDFRAHEAKLRREYRKRKKLESLGIEPEKSKELIGKDDVGKKDFYVLERKELHERLASSCTLNEKLVRHLKSLEKLIEDLLQHKFDSNFETITEKSDFMLNASKCLSESLNLSRVLSDNLSICEGSKLFEECESFANGSYSEEKDLSYLGLDIVTVPEESSYHESGSPSLIFKENTITQDFALEKFYLLVAEKYSKLKSLLDVLESIKNEESSNDGWIRLYRLVFTVGETLHKLHIAKENTKTSSVCGKCVVLDLFSNLKTSHVEADFHIDSASPEQKILEEFSGELLSLKEACKEPFSLLSETVHQKSVASQSDILTENEQINELENIIKSLTNKNKELNEDLAKVKQMLSKEKSELEPVNPENYNLLNEIDNLKVDLFNMKHKEKEFSLKDEILVKELSCVNENNSELNISVKNLEAKKKHSNTALDQF